MRLAVSAFLLSAPCAHAQLVVTALIEPEKVEIMHKDSDPSEPEQTFGPIASGATEDRVFRVTNSTATVLRRGHQLK